MPDGDLLSDITDIELLFNAAVFFAWWPSYEFEVSILIRAYTLAAFWFAQIPFLTPGRSLGTVEEV